MWYKYDKSRMKAMSVDFLRHTCDIRIDRVRNEVVQNLCGVKEPGWESKSVCAWVS